VPRQATLLRAIVVGFAVALSACGFKLRGSRDLPFDTIFLAFPQNSPIGAELARNIRTGTNARVVTERAQAQSVLEMLTEHREREVLSVNAQGRAREYQLRYRVVFRVHDGKGRDFIGPSELVVQRDIAFNESQVLARESEEALLFRDMQSDVVQQMLRRIGAIKSAALAPAPAVASLRAAPVPDAAQA
jgi:LPS-assembly lipoprotein